MNSRQRLTLEAIFAKPARPDVRWSDIESLVTGLGGEVIERRGSRVAFVLGEGQAERVAIFHRPHPSPLTDKGALVAVRKFLIEAGGEP